jgi:hypothetical protein
MAKTKVQGVEWSELDALREIEETRLCEQIRNRNFSELDRLFEIEKKLLAERFEKITRDGDWDYPLLRSYICVNFAERLRGVFGNFLAGCFYEVSEYVLNDSRAGRSFASAETAETFSTSELPEVVRFLSEHNYPLMINRKAVALYLESKSASGVQNGKPE